MTRLGELVREIKEESGVSLGDLTVLSTQNDPFRLDTQTNHDNGAWFRDQMEACGLLSRANPIHNRGIHYAIVSRGDAKLPSGRLYRNDAECWAFLELRASKAGRWLGYVPFDKVIDARNAEPIIRIAEEPSPRWSISIASVWDLPATKDLEPQIRVDGFHQLQLYKLVFFGEKTSLGEVLSPLAEEFGADLYLMTGEITARGYSNA